LKATAVLPVKRFAAAKQRLAPGMGGTHRAELAAAMMEDARVAIAAARALERRREIRGPPVRIRQILV
jgi:2-phospho-L-lactate guanylyltransferase (CobY/MobA/RfbA family)